MKKLALLFCLFWIAFIGNAQQFPTNPETGKVTYSEVVTVEGVGQKELYNRAKTWVATYFNSAPDVIHLDSENKIIIKGIQRYSTSNLAGDAPSNLYFLMTIELKEGRYKYETTNFSEDGIAPIESAALNPKVIYTKDGNIRAFNRNMVESIRKGINDLNGSLKKAMATDAKGTDW